jgi:hypothetical protein
MKLYKRNNSMDYSGEVAPYELCFDMEQPIERINVFKENC